jgi:3',5'-cyclic AMP phosphodiesterase CpdA
MQFAIISDTHFGDDKSGLVRPYGNKVMLGSKYDALKNAVGTGNDYLILTGDILDFSKIEQEAGFGKHKF